MFRNARKAVSPYKDRRGSYNAANSHPRQAGKKKWRLRFLMLAVGGVAFYLCLMYTALRILRDYTPLEESEHKKKLSDFFKAPKIRKNEKPDIGRRIESVQEVDNDLGRKGSDRAPQRSEWNIDNDQNRKEKLRIKLDRFKNEGDDSRQQLPLWELSDFATPWMKEYFEWHRRKRQTLTEELWQQWKKNTTANILDAVSGDTKFLVVQCMQSNTKISNEQESCGNLMERLGLLPYWLRMAFETNRILFLHWTVPTDLSEFLEPPVGGCDWRAPMWLQQLLLDHEQGVLINNATKILSNSSYLQSLNSESLLRVQVKHSSEFEDRYNTESTVKKEPSFQQVFHDLWAILFVPSEVLRKGIGNAFRVNNGMELGKYTSIDLSSLLSPKDEEKKNSQARAIKNAIKVVSFVSRMLPGDPFMVVTDDNNVTLALSDHHYGVEKTRDAYISAIPDFLQMQYDVSIFARYQTQSNWAKKQGQKDPHKLLEQKLIDFDTADFPIHTPETFYDIFINFYLMSMGRCVISFKPGTFDDLDSAMNHTTSRLASLIGYDSNCYCRMVMKFFETLNMLGETSFLDYVHKPPDYGKIQAPSVGNYFRSAIIEDGADEMPHLSQQIREKKEHHGVNSTTFPRWMEEYLDWHRATKSQLTRSNWNATKYLIVGCFENYDHCGGISDRLKPLPMLLWEAYQGKRILLIWWERPKPLEEWLVPPGYSNGGIDWTVPPFLKEEILRGQPKIRKRHSDTTLTTWKTRDSFRSGFSKEIALVYSIQSPEAGEDHYTEGQISYAKQSFGMKSVNDASSFSYSAIVGSTYQDVFHDLFRRFFEPSPRLTKLLNAKMKQHNLVPGEYTAVHLRALYGERSDRDPKEALELAALGTNCASNLYPGTPVYFASDMSFAVDSAHAYGKLHDLPIVSLDSDPDIGGSNPIHLDKDPDWKKRPASAYDATFVDLYLLAESRCVAYSNGGYGLFGSLLSYEPECRMRFFKGRKKIKKCTWMNEKFERQELRLPEVDAVVVGGRVEK